VFRIGAFADFRSRIRICEEKKSFHSGSRNPDPI
jgi:hypothetical protein